MFVWRIYTELSLQPADELIFRFESKQGLAHRKVKRLTRFSSIAPFLCVMQRCHLHIHIQEHKACFLSVCLSIHLSGRWPEIINMISPE